MQVLSRRSVLGLATVVISGLCHGCADTANEVSVPKGEGAPPVAPPKDMKEWYEKNKAPTTKKKG
jgi:hypothetical protein